MFAAISDACSALAFIEPGFVLDPAGFAALVASSAAVAVGFVIRQELSPLGCLAQF
ncbi:MAG TPA: hypothetical protein VIX91_23460 [Candidatus Acidoferrum sp.]